MILKDITLHTIEENVLYDEALLQLAEKEGGGEVLRFWESREICIVLGRIGEIEEEVYVERTQEDGIPIIRRTSGGGTVLQGKGCLNFTLILNKDKDPRLNDIRSSYAIILSKIKEAMAACGVEAIVQPLSDLALKNSMKKFSGNAQHRKKNYILHHGTILYDFDLSLIEKYLPFPAKVPDYRRGRRHLEFVTNITKRPEDIKQSIKGVFPITEYVSFLNKRENLLLKKLQYQKHYAVGIPHAMESRV